MYEMTGAPWEAVAVLVDPVRRSLYDHIRRQRRPVTREEAADAVAISRNLTAFHLEKLVEAGLLRSRYEAPTDQPRGRGRTPKVYEATDEGVSLTVPMRQYELVGAILADAVASDPTDAGAAARRRATAAGRDIGADARNPPASGTNAIRGVLRDLGFEPIADRAGIALSNCPFHRLAQRQTTLVCGLNEAFIRGLLDGLGATNLRARLAPTPGACCVRVEPRPIGGPNSTR